MSQSGSYQRNVIPAIPVTVPQGGTGVVSITDHALLVGSGVAAVTVLAAATDGQLCIGSTGADPAIAALASAGGTITITNGAGTIDLAIAGAVSVQFDGDAGTAVPALGILDILGGTNISTSAALNDVTINLDAAISGTTSHDFAAGGRIGTALLAGNTLLFQAYDVDGVAYTTFATLTANNTPTMDLDTAVTIDTQHIYRAGDLIPVGDGGTGVSNPADHALLVGSGVAALTELTVGTDGQLLIGDSADDPVFADLTSTNGTVTVTAGAGTLDLSVGPAFLIPSGFATWGGAGNYFDDTTLGEFEVLRPGTGYIKGVPISWVGSQTVVGMLAGNTYLIYMDDTGTIGKTTTISQATYEDNIVLFECLRDSTAVTNNQVTVKDNHPYDFPVASSSWAHVTVGTVIENRDGGANITLNGTVKIQINGADELSDHGLTTDIPDSAGVGVVFNQYFTLGSGKWARYLQSDTFNGQWNNAGTATALGSNKFSVATLYVSKDNITSSTPVYFSILDTAQYNNIGAAQTAIADGSTAMLSGELASLEIARLGYIIFSESAGEIVDVIIDKQTVSSGSTTSGTNVASLVTTSTTNFDGILSVADTNVQAALDTIDDWGKTATDHGVLIGQGVNTPVVAQVLTDGQLIVGSTGIDPVAATITAGAGIGVANAAGSITISATGVDQIDVYYVGKHGDDGDDGLTIEKAKLTFGSALTAASSGDTIWCFDEGTYTEDLTGLNGINIFAPNAIVAGAHTMAQDNNWTFGTINIATATTGFIFNSAGEEAHLKAKHMTLSGTGDGIINVGGQFFVDIDHISIENGQFIDATTSDTVAVNFVDIVFTGTGTAFAGVAGCTLEIMGNSIENDGVAGAGEIFLTAGGGTPYMNAHIVHITSTYLSDITAASEVRLVCATLHGALGEAGAGLVIVCGATMIEDVPIGAAVPSSGAFTTLTASTPIGVASGGIGVGTLTDHGVLLGSGVGAITPLGVATDGQLVIGDTGTDPVLATLTAGAGINIANAGGSITITNTGTAVAWSIIVADLDPMIVNTAYICNKAGLLTVTLPATAAVGTIQRVTGINTDLGWLIEQRANQIIHFGDTSTTTGVGGSLASVDKRDSVEIVCVVADTEWNVISSVGNITIV